MHTNYDRDEDGEPGLAEEEDIERRGDYLASVYENEGPAAAKAAAKALAMAEASERWDEDHADAEPPDADDDDAEWRHRYDSEDRAIRRAESGGGDW